MKKIAFLVLCCFTFYRVEAAINDSGHILFLVQQGENNQALDLYKEYVKKIGHHDFDLIHKIGLGILDQGYRQKDPEIQLMALFGASISAHDDAYYIIEQCSQSPFPQIQLVSINALARIQNDRADQAILRAMTSNQPLIRLEAAFLLCQKNHPQAISQTESLMCKMPKEVHPLFAQLIAIVGNEQSTRILRKMLNDPSEKVRIAAVLCSAENGRDDLLPEIRQLTSQLSFAQQEACAKALGILKDEKSRAKLQRLTSSQYPYVALTAHQSLYQLGDEESTQPIIESVQKGNVFAITLLGQIEGSEDLLVTLLDNPDIQIRVNASIALLEREDPRCLPGLSEILIRDKRDLGFTRLSSPSGALTGWKAVTSASQILKEDEAAYSQNINFKEKILRHVRDLPETSFLELAEGILYRRQNELIPVVIELLIDLRTENAINLLKKYQQQIGAPLLRQSCNLALYELKEEGPYGTYLREWVKAQQNHEMIHFRPFLSWDKRDSDDTYTLTPEETAALLIHAFEAFAVNQDDEGINLLLDAIQYGNAKNKYALAGLLVRATQ